MKYVYITVILVALVSLYNSQTESYSEEDWIKTKPSGYYKTWEKSAVKWLKLHLEESYDFEGYEEPKECPEHFYQKNGFGLFYKICFYADKIKDEPEPQTGWNDPSQQTDSRKEIDFIVFREVDNWTLMDKKESIIN